jgi:hypothetical protein
MSEFSSDIGQNTKCIADSGNLLLARGTWSTVTLHSVDLSVTPPKVELSDKTLSVTSPSVLAFGSTGCDSEKMCHAVGSSLINAESGNLFFILFLQFDIYICLMIVQPYKLARIYR